jgi:hypothetical protein
MPRFPHVLWGIVMLTCACANPAAQLAQRLPGVEPPARAAATPTPSSVPVLGSSNAPWPLELQLSGELSGAVSATAPAGGTLRNECTGKNSSRGGRWASTMLMDVGPERVGEVILVEGYKGAGTFAGAISVEVHTLDVARVWHNRPEDPVSFTVYPDEESGRVDATLSNAAAPTQKLQLKGRWSCRT